MTDLKDLVLTIVRPLVTNPEAITLEVVESADFFEYNLSVAPEDIGRIIGKQGRVAKAIRTIVYGVRTDGPKKVRLNILDGQATQKH
ncbi:MAG: KH domain-containing protein [Enterococcus sp.]